MEIPKGRNIMANPNSILFKNIDPKRTGTWYEVKAISHLVHGAFTVSYNVEINRGGQMKPRIVEDLSKTKIDLFYKYTVAVPGGHGMRMRIRLIRKPA